MPLLAHRYRYMYTLSQSDLTQLVCAIDTIQHCAPAADGRRQPLLVNKILNAQHGPRCAGVERVRLLARAVAPRHARVLVRALSHCEVDAHFCIVWEMPRRSVGHATPAAAACSQGRCSWQPVRPPPAVPGAPAPQGEPAAPERSARPRGRRSELCGGAGLPQPHRRRRRRALALQAAAAGCRGAAAAPAAVAPVQPPRCPGSGSEFSSGGAASLEAMS